MISRQSFDDRLCLVHHTILQLKLSCIHWGSPSVSLVAVLPLPLRIAELLLDARNLLAVTRVLSNVVAQLHGRVPFGSLELDDDVQWLTLLMLCCRCKVVGKERANAKACIQTCVLCDSFVCYTFVHIQRVGEYNRLCGLDVLLVIETLHLCDKFDRITRILAGAGKDVSIPCVVWSIGRISGKIRWRFPSKCFEEIIRAKGVCQGDAQ